MKQHFFFLFTIILLGRIVNLSAQNATAPLDHYLTEAMKSNIALQQKELSYEKSLAALEEAKSMFFPSLSLQARYSVAGGGRTIDFPVGDLLNPVYDNLNLINARNSAAVPDYPTIPNYPNIQNEQINFLRTTEHETKLRVVFPVFNAAILNNHRIKKELTRAEQITVDIYKRELTKEVKTAYFNYLQAVEGVALFENTQQLVKENLRTSESLHKHHKVTVDVVYTAEAQVKSVEQQKAEAIKNEQTAKAYFNFLLNRNYDEGIEIMDIATVQLMQPSSLEEFRNKAFSSREELSQIDQYLKVSDNNIQLQRGDFLPQVNLVGDYGFQGTNYRFGKEDDFVMGSVVLSWNIFNKPTKAKIQQAQIEKTVLQKQRQEAQQQIGLQVVSAYYDLEAAAKNLDLAKAEKESAEKAFKLVNKKFTQGQANLVELTDARTQMTLAAQKQIIARYNYQIKLAELERAAP